MKCVRCPLLYEWNNENDRGAVCRLFGDGWDSQFQYEDEHGIVGCYIDRHYIKKVADEYDKQFDFVEEWIREEGNR